MGADMILRKITDDQAKEFAESEEKFKEYEDKYDFTANRGNFVNLDRSFDMLQYLLTEGEETVVWGKIGTSATLYMECRTGGSKKAYQIQCNGTRTSVSFGKIGSLGSATSQDHYTQQALIEYLTKTVAEKLSKGYVPADTKTSKPNLKVPEPLPGAAAEAEEVVEEPKQRPTRKRTRAQRAEEDEDDEPPAKRAKKADGEAEAAPAAPADPRATKLTKFGDISKLKAADLTRELKLRHLSTDGSQAHKQTRLFLYLHGIGTTAAKAGNDNKAKYFLRKGGQHGGETVFPDGARIVGSAEVKEFNDFIQTVTEDSLKSHWDTERMYHGGALLPGVSLETVNPENELKYVLANFGPLKEFIAGCVASNSGVLIIVQ